jgi:hypothetical protein
MSKEFRALAVGDKFIYKDIIYIKIPEERISCCKVFNAQNIDNKEKTMIKPLDKVELKQQ